MTALLDIWTNLSVEDCALLIWAGATLVMMLWCRS